MVTTCLPLLVLSALHLNGGGGGGFNQRDIFSSLLEHYSFTSQSQPVTCGKVCVQLFLTLNINHFSIWDWTCTINHQRELRILTKWIKLSVKRMSCQDPILTKMFGGYISLLCSCGCFCVVYICALWCVSMYNNPFATHRIILWFIQPKCAHTSTVCVNRRKQTVFNKK